MRIVDQLQCCLNHFGNIVAGNVCCHTHSDTAGAIGQQIGEQAGKDFRLLILVIIGRDEIDRALVQTVHQTQRRFGQARFCVAIGCGIIAIDIAEIALPLDQRVPQ